MANGNNGKNGGIIPVKPETKGLIEWAFRLISLTLIPFLIWVASLMVSLDKRVSLIESNRFTIQMGYDLEQKIFQMERDLRADMPPEEWKLRITRLEECQRQLIVGRDC